MFFTIPFSTLSNSTKSLSLTSDKSFLCKVTDNLNLSAPGAAKLVNPFALSYNEESSFALTTSSSHLFM